MIAAPKLVLLIVIAFAVWYAVRWFNRNAAKAVRRGASAAGSGSARTARPQQAVEDLVSCRICGAYVATSARHCGKAGCPRPA